MGLDGVSLEELKNDPRFRDDYEDIMGEGIESFSHLSFNEFDEKTKKEVVGKRIEVAVKPAVNVKS
jgi:hypothetical protein